MLIGHFDGSSRGNPGPAGIAAVLIDSKTGKILWEMCKNIGHRTNNEAEYLALIELLKYLVKTETRNVVIRGDSRVVVNQVNRQWRVNESHLWPLCFQARELMRECEVARLEWVPREQNRYADRLSNRALNEKAAISVFETEKLEHVSGLIYIAHGSKDYAVDLANQACTCPAFQKLKDCKHLRAAEQVRKAVG